MFVFGDFDTVNGQPSNGLARFDGGALNPFGLELSGDIEDISVRFDDVVVLGNLSVGGQQYPLVFIGEDSIETIQIPERPGAAALAYSTTGGLNSFYLVVEGDQANESEIWEYDESLNLWELVVEVDGEVNGFTYSSDGRIAYGVFDVVRTYDSGALDTSFATNNMVRLALSNVYPINGETSDTVLCAYRFGNVVYFGGASMEGPVLSKYFAYGSIQPLLNGGLVYPWRRSVRALDKFDEGNLIVGGELSFGPSEGSVGIGYYGSNLGLYNPFGHTTPPLGYFEEPVNAVWKYNDQWYVGGEFSDSTIQYIARIEGVTGTSEEEKLVASVYPNPVDDVLNITLRKKRSSSISAKLYDIAGRKVKEDSFNQETMQLDTRNLTAGKYVLMIFDGATTSSSIIIKQ